MFDSVWNTVESSKLAVLLYIYPKNIEGKNVKKLCKSGYKIR